MCLLLLIGLQFLPYFTWFGVKGGPVKALPTHNINSPLTFYVGPDTKTSQSHLLFFFFFLLFLNYPKSISESVSVYLRTLGHINKAHFQTDPFLKWLTSDQMASSSSIRHFAAHHSNFCLKVLSQLNKIQKVKGQQCVPVS